eukprot:TRINITY_DN624_c1_g1_i1.p1 TRINITY_DN624_c1_g1~~TRINITY_DN624_c1_g1_i1.p1  ORF type:complete len:488 (-),score=62.81 TRINITY_DN624_c1_g1_i1:1109-2506(-)
MSQGVNSQPFRFPLLPLNLLAEEINSLLGMQLLMNEIAKPTPEKVFTVYLKFLQDLNDSLFQKLSGISPEAMGGLDHPDIYADTLRLFKTRTAVRKMMLQAGVQGFTLKDLVQPEPRRFQNHLSALVNYKKFVDEKLQKFNDLQQQVEHQAGLSDQLKDANLKYTQEKKALQMKQSQEQREAQQVLLQVQELDQKRKVLQDQSQKLQTEARSMKTAYDQKKTELTSLTFDLQSAEQTRQQLKDQLVDSPEQLEIALQQVNNSLEVERTIIQEIEVKQRDCCSKCDSFKKLQSDMCRIIMQSEKVEEAIQEKKMLSRKFKSNQLALQEQSRQIEGEKLQESHRQKHSQMLQDKLNRQQQQQQQTLQSYQKALIEKQEEKQQVDQLVLEEKQMCLQNQQTIQGINSDIQQKQNAHDQAIAMMKEKEKQVCENISNRRSRINQILNNRYRSFQGLVDNQENVPNSSNQ